MSFYKEYKNRKDWRKPYYGVKSGQTGCSCSHCVKGRLHTQKRQQLSADSRKE